MKDFNIKIYSHGISHIAIIRDDEDLSVLRAILDKVYVDSVKQVQLIKQTENEK